MRVVNLSRRPFLNRRPVVRVSMLLWGVALVLFLVNLWLYGQHFRGSSVERDKLAAVGRQIDQEVARLERYADQVRSVNLRQGNARAQVLNRLIHRRTFPWSALFDDLERILPDEVYLAGVSPKIERQEPSRRRASQRRSDRLTPAEARRIAQARRRGEEIPETDAEQAIEIEEAPRDRVVLDLQAFAKNEDALFEFVENLYADPSFQDPFLSRESAENPGKLEFSVRVVYLTPAEQAEEAEEAEQLAEAEGASAEGASAEGEDVDAGAPRAVETSEGGRTVTARGEEVPTGAPPAEEELSRTTTSRRDVPSRGTRSEPTRTEAEMARRQDQAERARVQSARPGSPDAGSPDAGRPDAGSPDAGRPDAGRPDAGRPIVGTAVPGAPVGRAPEAEQPAEARRTSPSRVSVAPRTREETPAETSPPVEESRSGTTRTETERPSEVRPEASASPRPRRGGATR